MEGGAVTGNEVLDRTVNHADNGRSPAEPPSRPRNRKVLRTLALVVLLVIAGVLAWANWATVSKIFHGGDGSDRIIRLSGRIEGDDSAVAPKTSGRILEVRVREGDSVNAGQILAVLDDQQLRAREEQARGAVEGAVAKTKVAKAQIEVLEEQLRESQLQTEQATLDAEGRVSQAEADLAAAESDLARQEASFQLAAFDKEAYTRLAQTGAVSERQGKEAVANADQQAAAVAAAKRRIEATKGALTTAKANVANAAIRGAQSAAIRKQIAQQQAEIASATANAAQARAGLVEARANLQDLTVIAPFPGTVLTRTAEPGEVIQAGTAIVTLLDLTKVYLRGFIPEGRIGRVKIGQAARIYLDSQPDRPIAAYVLRIDPRATFTPENTYFQDDRVKQVVGVKLQLKDAIGFAKPGMPADGEGWPPSAGAAIQVQNLWKKYGDTEAVRGISFDVNKGEIFGLIGPDGAGKTSTFQVLAGVMEATSGAADVLGWPARQMRSQSGYLTQGFTLYPDLSVAENIRYVGVLRGIDPREIERRSHTYLENFDMLRFRDRLAGRLSGGMKQKLALVCALVPEPGVLLLDEPTTGVDPVSRREFWDALAHLAAEGLTILVSTPYLDEAERCHRVALMHAGTIRQIATPEELRNSLGLVRLELFTPQLAETERMLSELAGDGSIADVQRFGDRLDLLVKRPEEAKGIVAERMAAAGLDSAEVRSDMPTLENVFVVTLRKLGEEIHAVPFPHRRDYHRLHGQVAIGARGLTKEFGDFTAVRHVDVQIRYGEIYGLLGANVAGKTTSIKMLCGLLKPSRGEMALAGQAGGFRSREVRQRIGYMSQKFFLYDELTIAENLDFFSSVYGVPHQDRPEKMRWILSFSGLDGRQGQMTGSLPGGWKQRVAFGSAIMHEPSVLFLDEPTSGVDPLARRAFWSMINQLADRGAAVLVTTHYLEEAEQCNRLGLMVAGELVAEGSPAQIKAAQKGHVLEYVVDQPQRAADFLRIEGERWRVALFGDRLHVVTDEDARAAEQATTAKLNAFGIRVLQVRETRFSLEDVFISIVEKARLEGKIGAEG